VSGRATLVGIKLVIEVLDHYRGPDARKLWLIAWAEKANDRTRTGWPTREVLAQRTGRSPSRTSHIAEELVTEGVLKRDGGGNRSGPARFILLPITDAGKGAESAHPKAPVKSAAKAHPSDDGKGAGITHPETPRKSAASAHPKPKIKGAESARKGAESSRKGADSTPLPAETGSLPLIPSTELPSTTSVDPDEPTAQTIVARFIDWVRGKGGELTERTIGILSKQIKDLLRQGVSERHIRQGLADWHASGQHPSTLDSYVNAALNATSRDRPAQNGRPRDYSRGGAGDPLNNEDYSPGGIKL
jgi:hypothetical protein